MQMHKMRVLVLGNGLAGSEVQAVGLAQRLLNCYSSSHVNFSVKRFPLKSALYERMPNRMLAVFGQMCSNPYLGYDKSSVQSYVEEFAPNVVIGCGRSTVLLNLAIKLHNPEITSVQILKPYLSAKTVAPLDVVALPRHDGHSHSEIFSSPFTIKDYEDGPVVKTILGAIHDKTQPVLDRAKDMHKDSFGHLRAPRISVLVGAPHRHCYYSCEELETILADIYENLQTCGGTLSVIASRRTPPKFVKALSNGPGQFWGPGSHAPNPYLGALSLSDALIVTPDSITMTCEALAADPPLGSFVMMPEIAQGKFRHFFEDVKCCDHKGSLRDDLHLSPRLFLLDSSKRDEGVDELVNDILDIFNKKRPG